MRITFSTVMHAFASFFSGRSCLSDECAQKTHDAKQEAAKAATVVSCHGRTRRRQHPRFSRRLLDHLRPHVTEPVEENGFRRGRRMVLRDRRCANRNSYRLAAV
jgi:hypothetical protein